MDSMAAGGRMAAGFVYVFINSAMPGLVKIGRTRRTPEERAAEISTTGVPEQFTVVYDELVSDAETVEARLHERFAPMRLTRNREFFRVPIKEAISAVQHEATCFTLAASPSSECEVLSSLLAKYPMWMRRDYHSVKVVHLGGVCFLETTRLAHPGLRDEIAERSDLGFIDDSRGTMFNPDVPAALNGVRFVAELDPVSIVNCTDLFTPEASEQIMADHQRKLELRER